MILTGKCLEDFTKWFNKNYTNIYINESTSENAFIIEFLDSKEYYIDVEVIKDKSGGYVRGFESEVTYTRHGDLNMINSDCLKEDIYETRPEATNAAILKANEIYNLKHQ